MSSRLQGGVGKQFPRTDVGIDDRKWGREGGEKREGKDGKSAAAEGGERRVTQVGSLRRGPHDLGR